MQCRQCFTTTGHHHPKTKLKGGTGKTFRLLPEAKEVLDLLPRTLPALRAGLASTSGHRKSGTSEAMGQHVGCVAREWEEAVLKNKLLQ